MEDLGAPVSYMTLSDGAPVYTSDGQRVGKVAHVLADLQADVFEGIVVATHVLPPNHRFVDAEQVARIHERGVVLGLDSELFEALPAPSANPAAMATEADEVVPDELRDKLRRAWERISGKE